MQGAPPSCGELRCPQIVQRERTENMTVVNKNPEYFLTIASERSVSKAAEKLYVSQSYLSQHIAKLEQQLSVKLFNRNKNPIEITEAGKIYASYLESCHQLYQKLVADFDNLNQNREQTLQLGFSNWRASTLLPDILPTFVSRFSNVKVVLHEHPISEMYGLINNNQVDFVIMNTTLNTPDNVTTEIIMYEKILLVANRNNPMTQRLLKDRAAGRPLDMHLLEDERFIMLNPELTLARRVNNYLDKKQVVLHNQIITTNTSTSLNLTAENVGFSFLNETGLGRVPNREDMVFFDLQSSDLLQPLCVVYKKNTYLSPVAREFINITIEYYTKGQKERGGLAVQQAADPEE